MPDLRSLRRKAGLSLEALAKEAGCSVSTLRQAERGSRPSPEMQQRIAKALGTEADAIWCDAARVMGLTSAELDEWGVIAARHLHAQGYRFRDGQITRGTNPIRWYEVASDGSIVESGREAGWSNAPRDE